jgi:hypothetical protein
MPKRIASVAPPKSGKKIAHILAMIATKMDKPNPGRIVVFF